MTSLAGVLAEIADVQAEIYWGTQLAIVAPDATDFNVQHALQSMRAWRDRDRRSPGSVAFAGHALDRAAVRLRIRVAS